MTLLSSDAFYQTIVKIRVFLKSNLAHSPYEYVSNITGLINLSRNVGLSDPLTS
jgi:hypothetical protein